MGWRRSFDRRDCNSVILSTGGGDATLATIPSDDGHSPGQLVIGVVRILVKKSKKQLGVGWREKVDLVIVKRFTVAVTHVFPHTACALRTLAEASINPCHCLHSIQAKMFTILINDGIKQKQSSTCRSLISAHLLQSDRKKSNIQKPSSLSKKGKKTKTALVCKSKPKQTTKLRLKMHRKCIVN